MAEERDQKILRYLNGEMKPGETTAFERQISLDSDLEQEVAFHRDLLLGIQFYGDQQLKGRIEAAEINAYDRGLLFTEQHIQEYLQGGLTENEVTILEKRMANDQKFKETVSFHKDLLSGISFAGDQQLKADIQEAAAKMEGRGFFEEPVSQKQEAVTKRPKAGIFSIISRRNLAMAASFLLLLSVGYFLFQPGNTYPDIYAMHFKTDGQLRGAESKQLSQIVAAIPDADQRGQLETALQAYADGEHKLAVDLFDAYRAIYPKDDIGQFFHGLSFMKIDQYSRAIANFDLLLQGSNPKYKPDAIWFKGLSFLQISGKKEEALTVFRQIVASETSPYIIQAKAILQELE